MDRARELDSDKQRMRDMGSRDAAFCVNRGKCTVRQLGRDAALSAKTGGGIQSPHDILFSGECSILTRFYLMVSVGGSVLICCAVFVGFSVSTQENANLDAQPLPRGL